MGHRCFISFKQEDEYYKEEIQKLEIDMIDKSLNVAINSEDEDHIMRKIRENHLSDSTVTIHLIGEHGAENKGDVEQYFIKRELRSSLYHGENNTQNGILGIVLPAVYDLVFGNSFQCSNCGNLHSYVRINDSITIKEFSYNYYIPNNKCAHSEEDRYCVLVKWDDFLKDPERYINQAFDKRFHPIAEKTKVRP